MRWRNRTRGSTTPQKRYEDVIQKESRKIRSKTTGKRYFTRKEAQETSEDSALDFRFLSNFGLEGALGNKLETITSLWWAARRRQREGHTRDPISPAGPSLKNAPAEKNCIKSVGGPPRSQKWGEKTRPGPKPVETVLCWCMGLLKDNNKKKGKKKPSGDKTAFWSTKQAGREQIGKDECRFKYAYQLILKCVPRGRNSREIQRKSVSKLYSWTSVNWSPLSEKAKTPRERG